MKLLLITTLTLVTTFSAFAQRHHGGGYYQHPQQGMKEKFILDIHSHTKGPQTIKLKQTLKRQYPGVAIRNLDLKAVRIVAKSKMGRGEAVLQVGQLTSYPQIIAGNPGSFHQQNPRTYDRVRIINPKYDSQGVWQVHLRGNIKVKKIVLIATQKNFHQNIVVNLNGQQLRGQNTLALKRMMKRQNPYLNFNQMKLVGVTLIAKSKMGRGQATLISGMQSSYPQTIAGNPRGFNRPGPRSFSQINFQAPRYSTLAQGKLQIALRGNIKVQKVIIKVQKMNRGMINRRY